MDVYLEACLPEANRLLGLINKNDFSPTYGSFDREYWHFRTRDYPATIPQYAVLSLVYLYKIKDKKNPYYGNPSVKKLVEAALMYWVKMQNKDGSYNESYPNDRSQPATAFSLFFSSQAFILCKNDIQKRFHKKILMAIEKAAEFVWNESESFSAIRGDPDVSNHDAGAIVGMYSAYAATGIEKFKIRAKIMLRDLLKLQKKEGWIQEYNGADIGYSTTTIFYLANYYIMSNDKEALEALKKLVDFVSHFFHPDGSIGGEYASRSTYFCMPSGFEILSKEIPLAESLSAFIRESIKNKKMLVPENFDDSNLRSFIFISNLQASYLFGKEKRESEEKLPFERADFIKEFKESKLYTVKKRDYYCIVSGAKGGAYRIYSIRKKKLIKISTGWIAKNKSIITTSVWDNDNECHLFDNKLVIKARFKKVKFQYSSPIKIAISRLFFPFLSNFSLTKKMLKAKLRDMVISGKKYTYFTLFKSIKFNNNGVEIEDRIISKKSVRMSFVESENFVNLWAYTNDLIDGSIREQKEKMKLKIDGVTASIKYSIK